ncbi:MAG TPA: extracellular solute-binding protein [Firmicutes bacterium]|nr:extracellular solute-binding protein [Bacillota bacterium]
MVKRAVLTLLLFSLVIGVFGAAATLAAGKPDLTIITYHSPGQTMNKILDMYAKKTGLNVKFVSVPASMYHDKVAMGLFNKVADWDMMWTFQGWTTEFEPYLEDITNKLPKALRDDISDAAAIATVKNGRWYGTPLFLSIYGLYYNKELFSRAGLKPPVNLDEMAAAAAKLTIDKNGDGLPDIYGFAREGAVLGLFSSFIQMIQNVGGAFLKEKDGKLVPAFNNEYGKRALYWIKQFYAAPWADPSAINTLGPDIRKAFAAGKLAMTYEGIGAVESFMRQEFPEMLKKTGLTIFPGDLGTKGALPGAKRSASLPGSMGLVIRKGTPNLEAAVGFAKFLVSPEIQKFSMTDYGFVAVRKSMINDADLVKQFPFIPVAFEQAKYPHERWADKYYNAEQEATTPSLQAYVLGEKTAEQALKEMEAEVIRVRSGK